jgi:hypothetical protein
MSKTALTATVTVSTVATVSADSMAHNVLQRAMSKTRVRARYSTSKPEGRILRTWCQWERRARPRTRAKTMALAAMDVCVLGVEGSVVKTRSTRDTAERAIQPAC